MTNAQNLEEEHVHRVYDEIASHFSQTRYKPWPVIHTFLNSIPPGSIVADIGCGNGKYMSINKDNIFYAGSDRSRNLLQHAHQLQPHADFCIADNLKLPYKSASFDHAISIAVIHHLSTDERRIQAIRELLRILRKDGRLLIFVWAFEQSETSKRKFETQDVMVSWNSKSQVFHRYYHVFKKGELEHISYAAIEGYYDAAIVQSGYDRDNWYVELKRNS